MQTVRGQQDGCLKKSALVNRDTLNRRRSAKLVNAAQIRTALFQAGSIRKYAFANQDIGKLMESALVMPYAVIVPSQTLFRNNPAALDELEELILHTLTTISDGITTERTRKL
ncbi:hypothetical protein AVEN_265806-1 [Araneus ventricosus]|uniref:Uncharacterized protein n=1 Tax=Araneus ventricosus TaxID=182803 RepID=A0A4Y2SFR0_ARAVE|nr:hypothetical protein AVEN_265806-1 [Araneus ventricosus]